MVFPGNRLKSIKPARGVCWAGLLILLALFSLWARTPVNPESRVLGLWVVRHQLTSPARIDSLLARAARWGITDLFVQVRGRGDAYYRSRYEPLAPGLDSTWDPLAYLLQRARALPVRVHAWVNVFYLWSNPQLPVHPRHLIWQHPDWLLLPDRDSAFSSHAPQVPWHREEGVYLSPLHPGVQQHLIQVFQDLLSRYPVQGLHLDYIRFPRGRGDFHPLTRASFRHKYVLDPLEFHDGRETFVQRFGQIGVEVYTDFWREYLSTGLNKFVEKLSRKLHRQFPHLILSAAVKPDPALAQLQFYQDWPQWLDAQWVDWVVPMNYSPDELVFERRLRTYMQLDCPERILIGVAFYNQPSWRAWNQVRRSTDFPFRGVVLFSYDQLAGEALPPDIQQSFQLGE